MELDYYLFKNKIKHKDFAEEIEVAPSTVTALAEKRFNPKLVIAMRIMLATKGKVMPIDLLKEKDFPTIKKLESKHELFIKNLNFSPKQVFRYQKKTGKILLT